MAVNETINATIVNGVISVDSVLERFLELVTAPYTHPDLLWITIPLVIALVAMDIYFGRYWQEELGWNTAFGNSLALLFVTMDLMRELWTSIAVPSFASLVSENLKGVIVVLFLGLGSLWLLLAHFFHILPKKLAFLVSSRLPTTVFAYLAIVLIYTQIPLDKITLISAVVLFIVLLVVLKLIQLFVPMYIPKETASELVRKGKRR